MITLANSSGWVLDLGLLLNRGVEVGNLVQAPTRSYHLLTRTTTSLRATDAGFTSKSGRPPRK